MTPIPQSSSLKIEKSMGKLGLNPQINYKHIYCLVFAWKNDVSIPDESVSERQSVIFLQLSCLILCQMPSIVTCYIQRRILSKT